MTLTFRVTTEKMEDLKAALDKMGKKLDKRGQGVLGSSYIVEDEKTLKLMVVYPLQNRVVNWQLNRDFKRLINKIDGNSTVQKIKS